MTGLVVQNHPSPNMSKIFPRRDEIKKKAPNSGAMECEQLRSFPLPETIPASLPLKIGGFPLEFRRFLEFPPFLGAFAVSFREFAPKGNESSNHPWLQVLWLFVSGRLLYLFFAKGLRGLKCHPVLFGDIQQMATGAFNRHLVGFHGTGEPRKKKNSDTFH